ncbi:hypothetical protein BCD48_31860 [Pseudofrankia sp. BMG5.36]|nr:hypothetical protein BCD48_31860 [Pseudofrankia sp. BMG5.36]
MTALLYLPALVASTGPFSDSLILGRAATASVFGLLSQSSPGFSVSRASIEILHSPAQGSVSVARMVSIALA